MDTETLLRQVDPALRAEIPGPDSPEGLRIRDAALSGRAPVEPARSIPAHRTMGISISAVVAVAATVVLLVVLLPASVGTSKASAALTRLAAQAATVPTALSPGQYAYTEVEQSPTMVSGGTPTPGGTPFTEYFTGTVQTWVAADGSGRRVTTMDPTPHFYTAYDRTLWIAAGSPAGAVPPGQLTTVQTFGPTTAAEVNGPIPLYNVAELPTDPTALSAILNNENPGAQSLGTLPAGIKSLDFASSCSTAACTLFERTVALLQGPDVGASPALRQALYEVLSAVPGVELLGTTTDQAGQSGVGLALVQHRPAQTIKVECTSDAGTTVTTTPEYSPASTTTYSIVVDPQTTTLLSSQESTTPLVTMMPTSPPCLPTSGSHKLERSENGPNWHDVVNSGVVTSETATPSAASAR
jgi:hypothetical protein